MLDYAFRLQRAFASAVNSLDSTQWFWVTVVVCAVGFMCMRGFGSRTNY